MRKKLVLSFAVAVLLLTPPGALAGAGAKKYAGAFTGGGELSFKVEKREAGKKVVRFKFQDLPVTCGGIPKLTSGSVTYSVSVQRNRFSTEAIFGNAKDPKSKLVLRGELSKRSASGTLRVSGSAVNVGGDPPDRDRCDSGKVSWTAEKT